MTESEDLTVVVIPLVGGLALEACLLALPTAEVPCITVLPGSTEEGADWRRRFPQIEFIDAGPRSVPALRRLGVDAARTNIVAILEDTSLPVPGWCRAVFDAFAEPNVAAVGGPVDISSTLPRRFQALGVSEYGRFHERRFSALQAGKQIPGGVMPVDRLPGNNLAYRRKYLLEAMSSREGGLIESDCNEALRNSGHVLAYQPAMKVAYAAVYPKGASLAARFNHGRIYAGIRTGDRGWRARLSWHLMSFALFVILPARALSLASVAVSRRAYPGVAMWLVAMECAWATGECLGYLIGPGRSLERWR